MRLALSLPIEVLALGKVHLATMVGVLTEDCSIGTNEVRFNNFEKANCQGAFSICDDLSDLHFEILGIPTNRRL